MKCPNCGTNVLGQKKFCPDCGSSMNCSTQNSIDPIPKESEQTKKGGLVKLIALLLAVVLVIGVCVGMFSGKNDAVDAPPTEDPETQPTSVPGKFAGVKTGDTVYFGEYGNESIAWNVLEVREGYALLITEYGQDCVVYDAQNRNDFSPEAVSWNNCTLRGWLNDEFYYAAFSTDDRELILTVDEDGVCDPVFILSDDQLEQYFPTRTSRISSATAYAIERGAFCENGSWWWIRSNQATSKVTTVNSDGTLDKGSRVNGIKGTVRPVIWVNTA